MILFSSEFSLYTSHFINLYWATYCFETSMIVLSWILMDWFYLLWKGKLLNFTPKCKCLGVYLYFLHPVPWNWYRVSFDKFVDDWYKLPNYFSPNLYFLESPNMVTINKRRLYSPSHIHAVDMRRGGLAGL